MNYRTKDGDRVDLIAWHVYGSAQHAQAIYEANPHLCQQPFILPAGIILELPTIKTETKPTIELWSR